MTKKLLSLLVAALMVLTLLPAAAFAKTSVNGRESARIISKPGISNIKLTDKTRAAEAPARDEVVLTDLILDQDFETSMSGWGLYNVDGNTATYNSNDWSNWRWLSFTDSSGNNFAHGGDGALYSASWYGNAFNQDNWVCTPEITIPATGYCLSYYACSLDESYPDHLQVLVGESGIAYDDDGITTSAWVSLIDLYEVPAEYEQKTIDLSEYAGKSIELAFRHVDNNQYIVALDDIQVGLGEGAVITPETGITISDATAALTLTEGKQLTATVVPADATYQTITWTSSDPSVVAVNNIGGIIAMGVGTATITATSHSGYTATCTVTVSEGQYEFVDEFVAYGIYDLDTETENTWYTMDRFGTAVTDATGDTTFYVSEYNPADGLLYAYEEVANTSGDTTTYTYNFLSFDVENNYAKTTIATGLDIMPEWMAYNFDDMVMYGAFYYQDSDENIHFDIAEIDLTTGEESTLLIDTYNEPYGSDSDIWGLAPQLGTYCGDGLFIIATSNLILLMDPDYNDSGLAIGYLADGQATVNDQICSMTQYAQKLWLNPTDGMLYWAAIFGNTCTMVVTDLVTGISVPTGVTGLAGETYGMQTTALFVPYTVAPATHTVTFVDGLTGEPIATVEVEDGAAATAPEAPVHEGYTFTGWDVDFSNVTADLTVTAQYTINQYLVTFIDGLTGDIIYKDFVNYGAAATAPDAPVHEGYTFTGWDVDFSNITSDLTVTAQYEENGPAVTLLGDVDLDGEVTAADALLAMRHAMSITTIEGQGFVNGDMDGDGAITASDAILIMRAVMAI